VPPDATGCLAHRGVPLGLSLHPVAALLAADLDRMREGCEARVAALAAQLKQRADADGERGGAAAGLIRAGEGRREAEALRAALDVAERRAARWEGDARREAFAAREAEAALRQARRAGGGGAAATDAEAAAAGLRAQAAAQAEELTALRAERGRLGATLRCIKEMMASAAGEDPLAVAVAEQLAFGVPVEAAPRPASGASAASTAARTSAWEVSPAPADHTVFDAEARARVSGVFHALQPFSPVVAPAAAASPPPAARGGAGREGEEEQHRRAVGAGTDLVDHLGARPDALDEAAMARILDPPGGGRAAARVPGRESAPASASKSPRGAPVDAASPGWPAGSLSLPGSRAPSPGADALATPPRGGAKAALSSSWLDAENSGEASFGPVVPPAQRAEPLRASAPAPRRLSGGGAKAAARRSLPAPALPARRRSSFLGRPLIAEKALYEA
jgi:hypothetical protein